jgi:hypothetical protein
MKKLFGLKDENGNDVILSVNETSNMMLEIKNSQEVYLRKIAKEKGYAPGTRIINMDNGEIHTILNENHKYYPSDDSLHCHTPKEEWEHREQSDPVIYRKGVWAVILSDKKKYPTTKKEAKEFLTEYYKNGNMISFLEQYED